jgi:hypothetical protein
MAGRKITQLPTLTTPEATDKLVIVDVSDTSESPQGTSKQIAVSNLGLSSIESSTLDVTIADGVATVDLPYTRSVFSGNLNASSGVISSQINNLGGTISLSYSSDWNFSIERTGGEALTGVAVINFNNGTQDNETATVVFLTYGSAFLSFGDTVTVKFIDNTSPSVDGIVPYSFNIDYYPNGFDA